MKTQTYTPMNPKYARFKDILGQKFGRLTVIKLLGRGVFGTAGKGMAVWLCKCDCGSTCEISGNAMRTGHTQSCGCYKLEQISKAKTSHGMTGTKEYVAYSEAKKRCTYPKHNRFQRYGGRGIEFRFESFEDFFAELGQRPTPQHSVNRIDNNGHYEAGNVEWATKKAQASNTRRCHFITINGVTKTMTDWATAYNTDVRNIDARIRTLGWCDECAVTQPKRGSCVHVPHRNNIAPLGAVVV